MDPAPALSCPERRPAEAARQAMAVMLASRSGDSFDKKTILHIEDDRSHRELVANLLATRHELEVLIADEGKLGLALARRHHPHLVLLDLRLVGMQGEEVLKRLKQERETRHIPVIMVSADATPRQAGRLLQVGATAYVTKPFDVDGLFKVIDEALA